MTGRTTTVFPLLLILTLAVSPLSAQDWAGKGRAQGLVKDEAGNPVEGATITLKFPADGPIGGPEPFLTKKNGRWSFLGMQGGNWKVLIDMEGFLPSEGALYVNEFQPGQAVVITLERDLASSIQKGEELLEAGEFAAARVEYEKAMPAMDDVGKARLRSRIGDSYMYEGDFAAARAEYEACLPFIAPEEQTHIRLQMANSYQQEGEYAKARGEYEAIIPGLSPEGQASVLRTVAQGHGMQGNNAAAIETLERVVTLAPGDAAVLQLLADLLMREGRNEEAEKYMDMLPEDVELPTDMVLNMGIRLYNEGEMTEALEYFERAVAEHPESPEGLYYRGLTYLSQGRNDDAKTDFHKLLEIDPDSPHRAEVEEFLKFLEQGS